MRLVRLSAKCMAPLQERLKAVRGQMRVANNQHQRVVGDGDLLKEREDDKRNEKSQANHNQPTFNSNRSVTAPHCVQRIFNLHQLAGRATRASERNIRIARKAREERRGRRRRVELVVVSKPGFFITKYCYIPLH